MVSTPLFVGFYTGLALIVAIGAQSTFVLGQGIRKQHVWTVVLLCVASDVILILGGIAGIGMLLTSAPWISGASRIGGILFLLAYAGVSFHHSLYPSAKPSGTDGITLRRPIIISTLAITWLNPHVYLDTVVLLGTLSSTQGDPGRWLFGFGAILASIIWFSALGFGARLLHGFFARPLSWRILDAAVAAVMLAIAGVLITTVF